MPRARSALTVSVTPCSPQSVRPLVASADTKSRLPSALTSLCEPGRTYAARSRGRRGSEISHACQALQLPWKTMLPVKARSEFLSRASPGVVSLMNDADGRVLDTSVMFQRASPASNQPAFSPTRGSGLGGAADMLDALGTFPVPAAGIGMVS